MTRPCPKCGLENDIERDFCARPGCDGYLRWEKTVMVPAVRRQAAAPQSPAPEERPPARPAPVADPHGVPAPPEPAPPAPPPPPPEPGRDTLVAPSRPVERPTALLAYRRAEDDGYESGPLQLRVEPGSEARVFLLVRNQDAIVDRYDVQVIGTPAAWTTVTAPFVDLMPFASGRDYEREVQIVLHPPRSPEAEAGTRKLRIVAVSKAHKRVAASMPCTLEIAPFHEHAARIEPVSASGRRRATFQLAVRNLGNAPAAVAVSGRDDQANLDFYVASPELALAPGQEAATVVRVRPPRPLWFASAAERPFELVTHRLGADAAEPVRTPAAFRPRPWIPRWTLLALPLLALAAILAFFLVFNRVEVPRLAGVQGEFRAGALLKKQGLEIGTVKRKVDRNSKPGTVVDQDVPAGKKVRKGSAVGILVALGAGGAKLPDVVGQTVPAAEARLTDAGFQVGRVSPDPVEPVRQRVVRQVPAGGKPKQKGTPVTLFVGPPAKDGGRTHKIPAGITGAPVAKAIAALAGVGLTAKTVKAFSATAAAGTVVSQVPPEGGELAGGKPVRLTVSAGYPRLAYDNARGALVFAGREGHGATRRVPGAARAGNTEPAWAPDGTWIAFRRGGGQTGRIFRMDAATMGGVRPLTARGNDDGRPAVAPDGRAVAFIRTESSGTDRAQSKLCLTTVSSKVASARCIDSPSASVGRPAWSPDGRTLLVLAPDDQKQLEVRAFRSRIPSSPHSGDWKPRSILTDGVGHGDRAGDYVASAAWAPAGPPRLAVLANWGTPNAGAYRLFVGPVDGRGVPQDLTPVGSVMGCELAWRSDGRAVAIANHAGCERGTSGEVRVVDLAKPEPRTLPVPGANPAWEPLKLGP